MSVIAVGRKRAECATEEIDFSVLLRLCRRRASEALTALSASRTAGLRESTRSTVSWRERESAGPASEPEEAATKRTLNRRTS
jgi:hypothetical protein